MHWFTENLHLFIHLNIPVVMCCYSSIIQLWQCWSEVKLLFARIFFFVGGGHINLLLADCRRQFDWLKESKTRVVQHLHPFFETCALKRCTSADVNPQQIVSSLDMYTCCYWLNTECCIWLFFNVVAHLFPSIYYFCPSKL